MRQVGPVRAVWGAGLAAGLLIAAVGCGEEIQSPSSPESTPATSATPAALQLTAAANSWTTRAAIPAYRGAFVAGAVPNAAGEWIVYVLGGKNANGDTGLGGFAYNVVSNAWKNAPGSFVNAAGMNGAARLGNKLYFTGGESCCDNDDFRTFNTTWAYTTTTGTLLKKANMPRATKYGVTGVIKGKVYVLPGFCSGESVDPGHCSTGGYTRQLYRYDPSTNTWISRPQAPHFHPFGAAAVINDKLYVVGGRGFGSFLDVYDPVTNSWQTKAPIPTQGEVFYGAALLTKFFVVAWSATSEGVGSKAYAYDPGTNSWVSRAAPPTTLAGPIVKVVLNGQSKLFLPTRSGSSYMYTP